MKSTKAKYSQSAVAANHARGEDKTRADAPVAKSLGKDFSKSARVVEPKKPSKSRNPPQKQKPSPSLDPLEALVGTWTFGDADTYVRQQREGWE